MEKKNTNISPAVRSAMNSVENTMECVDVDSLDAKQRRAFDKIVKKYDQTTELFEKHSGGREDLFVQRQKIIAVCKKTAQKLMQFTTLSNVIAAELTRSIDEIPRMPNRQDFESVSPQYVQNVKENVSQNVQNVNHSLSKTLRDVDEQETYDIIRGSEKTDITNNKKNMRFEDPVKKYSKERDADLTAELEEIEKKIKETKISLNNTINNDAANIVMREEDLRRYEKNKAELLARKNENFFANVTGGPDEPSKKFVYQPVDRSQNTNNTDDVQNVNVAPKTDDSVVPTANNSPNAQNMTQTSAQENVVTQAQNAQTVATETILKRDIPHSGGSSFVRETKPQKNEQDKNTQDVDLVHDPEAAAMGGFDAKVQSASTSHVQNSERANPIIMDEEEKFDREVARRAAAASGNSPERTNRDTDMNEEEKFDREVARRAAAASGNSPERTNRDTDMNEEEKFDREVEKREKEGNHALKEVEKKVRLDEAKKNLDDLREALVVKRRRGESAMNKIRSLLGMQIGSTNFNEEIKQLEEEYLAAQKKYSDILAEDTNNLTEVEQKQINEEIRFMSYQESQKMYDAEAKARLETAMGTVGDKIHKVGLWYKNLPKGVKYSMAAAMLLAGFVTGGAGFAGAAVGTAAVAKRFFGAAAVGAGVGMALETRATAKKQAEHQTEREAFTALTAEQQKEILACMDNDTLQRLSAMQTSRRRVKFASITAGAAVLTFGKVASAAWHTFDGDAAIQKASDVAHGVAQKVATFGSNVFAGEEMMATAAQLNTSAGKTASTAWQTFDGDAAIQKASDVAHGVAQKVATFGSNVFAGEEMMATAAQLNTVASVDNVDSMMSHLAKMQGIVLDAKTGIGSLVIEKNGNYIKTLAAFLEKNQDNLTSGKMGWDPSKYQDAHDWAMRRATVLANEYRAGHKGIDLDFVRPGTEIQVNLKDLADIKTDVNFEGGPRIIPDGVKVEMAHGFSTADIAQKIGLSESVYQATRDMPASDFINDLKNHSTRTPFEEKLLQYAEKNPDVMDGKKTLGDVLEKNYNKIDIVQQNVAPISNNVDMEQMTSGRGVDQEIAQVKEHMSSLEFKRQMEEQTHKIFGMKIENIHAAKVQFLAEHNPELAEKLTAISQQSGISFNSDTKVSTYMARAVAKGVKFEDLKIVA